MSVIEKLIEAADNHAEDTGEDHNVGDLQDMLRWAWELMTPDQQRRFVNGDAVENVIDSGARGEFTAGSLALEIVG